MLKRLLSSVFLCFALVFGTVSAASAYTVTYSCSGQGTPPSSQTISQNATLTPRANTCNSASGAHFVGWKVSGTTYDIVYPGQPFTYTYGANKTFTAVYTDGQFSVTTTNLTAGSTFSFKISAQGTFTIDCGSSTGGNFNNTGNAVGTITRSNTTQTTYTCSYTSAGVKTISFESSNVTAYNTANATPAINFSGNTMVAALNGDLTLLFPHLGSTTSSKLHRFPGAFKNCTNLTHIPATLFENLTTSGSSIYTFYQTFYGCTSLTFLPNKLFGSPGLAVVGSYGFYEIFSGCSGLTALPSGLFQNVTGSGSSLFGNAFYGCSGLTAIPKDLFAGITVGRNSMFRSTFENCTGLNTTISNKLFGSITTNTTSAPSLFQNTFKGCTNLTEIEEKFFSSVTNAANNMFRSTFENSGLKAIPKNLFGGVVTLDANATYLFCRTFYNCQGLKTVPNALFSSITIGATSMFELTFYNCILLPQIYDDWFSGITTAANRMFYQTFQKCESLQEIPDGLFGRQSINTNTAQYMFFETFRECVGIQMVYKSLFAGITSGATHMFDGTFYGCINLKDIGSDGGGLFRNISNTDSTHTHMFYRTFYGCSKLLYVPADTFKQIPVGASYMFHSTFYNCTGLEAIGDGLFKNIQTTTSSDTYMFHSTFYNCSSLSAIPDDTFADITVGASYMFGSTFYGCRSISSIGPLFMNIGTTTGATYMFSSTFMGCANVTSVDKFLFRGIRDAQVGMFSQTFSGNSSLVNIRAGLFSNIQSVASNTFYSTFFGCSSLTAIPVGLFSGITTLNTPNSLFFQTFYNCSSLTAIPDDLFDKITTSAESMFGSTFTNCSGLRSIPEPLFRRISVGAKSLFNSTFSGCTGLRSIPDALFANITTGAETMFTRAFYGCSGLTGYVPKKLFQGLIVNHVSPSTNMFNHTFTNTGLSTSCGTGMQEAWTGTSEWNTYVSYKTSPWNSGTVKVSCEYMSYTVTYNCGTCTGGSHTPPNSTTVTYNSSFSPASNSGGCIAPNSGYTFAGWAVSNTNPVVYRQPNTSFTWNYTENKTFTATCNPRNVTMNWFGEDGTTPFTPSNSAANQCVYDTSVTIPSNTPSKSGYHFVGWCLDTGLSPYWSEEWDMGYGIGELYWDASHARWEPIVQNGYTMYDEFGSGATSGGLNPGEWGYTFDTSMYASGTNTGKELLGRALCSATPGTHAQSGNPNQNTSGQHCWCAGIKYAESCEIASPSWVYSYDLNTEADCNAECAVQCVSDVYSDIDFGQAIFGVTQ